MASILIISKRGTGIPIALKLASEGHIVKVYISDQAARIKLEGYKNPRVVTKGGTIDQYDLILNDAPGLGELSDELKEKGKLVIGGGVFNDNLELETEYADIICRKLTNLSTGNNNGISIRTEGWFNGESFVFFDHAISHIRLMAGEHGPITEGMGSVLWSCGEDEIVKRALLPLQDLLKKVDYLGPISCQTMVDQDDICFNGWTARFHYDSIQALFELIKGNWFNFLWKLAMREKLTSVRDEYGMAIRLTMPPYPHNNGSSVQKLNGMQVMDPPKEARHHLHFSDVRLTNDVETLAGVDGIVGCVTSRGATIRECRKRAYRTIHNSVISRDVQFRKDIGLTVDNIVEKLKMWGWLDINDNTEKNQE